MLSATFAQDRAARESLNPFSSGGASSATNNGAFGSSSASSGWRNDWAGASSYASDPMIFAEDAAQRKAAMYLPQVIIRGQRMTDEQKLAFDIEQRMVNQPDAFEQARASDRQFYQSMGRHASNAATAVIAPIAGAFNGAGHDIADGVRGVVRLATNPQAQINAVKGLGYAMTHPGTMVNSASDGMMRFASMPPEERAAALLQFGAGGFATAGSGKALGMIGAGVSTTGKWLAPAAGDVIESYAAKTGLRVGIAPDGVGANAIVAYPEGLAYRTDLPNHLFGPDGFTRSGQLSGTHNLNNATSFLDSIGANYKLNPTSTPGISELNYNYTNPINGKSVVASKTVYDPSVHSNQVILDLSQKAGKIGFENYLRNPTKRVFDVTQSGINFRTYINIDPKTGMPFVGNIHPIK